MRRKTSGFLEKTLLAVLSLVRETMDNETIAGRGAFLQSRDPRLKTVACLLLLIAVLLSKSPAVIAALYGLCLILVAASRVGVAFFLKRTLPFIPLFSLFVALPAIFSFVTPGDSLAALSIGSWSVSITQQGVHTALLFFSRVLVSVSFAVLLVLTTRHHELLKTLRIFKVPQIFVMTMGMSYRYIFLLLDIIRNTFIAIKSRVGFVVPSYSGRKIATAIMAGLWLRSYRLHGQVYDAMVSRGYSGEPVTMHRFKTKPADIVFLASSILLLTGALWLNRFFH